MRQRRDQRIRWRHESRIWLRCAGGYSTPPKAAAAAAAAAGVAIVGRAGRPSPCRPTRAGMGTLASSWEFVLASERRTCLQRVRVLTFMSSALAEMYFWQQTALLRKEASA